MMLVIGNKRLNKGRSISSGFTLIELMIVLVVVGVLTGLIVPKLGGRLQGWRLSTSTRELQVFMDYLRERSVVEGKVYYLVIGPNGNEYWGRPEATGAPASARTHVRRLGEKIILESETKQVAFYPDGSIDKITIRLVSAEGRSETLTTLGSFGSVKIR